MFVVFGVVLLLCASITHAAPAGDVLPADAIINGTSTNVPEINSTTESTTPGIKICHYRTPCGWAVYNRISRNIDFFMKNICECPSDKTCAQGEDNLSVGAYVYHCEDPPPPTPPRKWPTTPIYYED